MVYICNLSIPRSTQYNIPNKRSQSVEEGGRWNECYSRNSYSEGIPYLYYAILPCSFVPLALPLRRRHLPADGHARVQYLYRSLDSPYHTCQQSPWHFPADWKPPTLPYFLFINLNSTQPPPPPFQFMKRSGVCWYPGSGHCPYCVHACRLDGCTYSVGW